jgi:hypothetical protein
MRPFEDRPIAFTAQMAPNILEFSIVTADDHAATRS